MMSQSYLDKPVPVFAVEPSSHELEFMKALCVWTCPCVLFHVFPIRNNLLMSHIVEDKCKPMTAVNTLSLSCFLHNRL